MTPRKSSKPASLEKELEELKRLSEGRSAGSPRPATPHAAHHDAFTRWWLETSDKLPTPEQVREFRPKFEKEQQQDPASARSQARRLLDLNPDFPGITSDGVASFKAQWGHDLTDLFDIDELNRCLVEERRARARRRIQPRKLDTKAAKMAYSASEERTTRKAAAKRKKAEAKTKSVSVAGSKKRSRVSATKAPRSIDRDRKIVAEIQGFLEAQVPVRLTPKRGELVRPGSVSPLLPASTKGRSTTHDPVIWLPNWEKASQPLRATAMGIACGENGGIDFTLHLGDSGITHAKGVGEMKFARRIYKRIEETLTKKEYRLLPEIDFMFFVEQGKGERPHLHGIVLPGAKLIRTAKPVLRKALREAVGTDWKATGRNRTQAELGRLYAPVGWISYITKYTEITKASIGDNLFAASRNITKLGREWYEQARADRRLLLPGKAANRRTAPM